MAHSFQHRPAFLIAVILAGALLVPRLAAEGVVERVAAVVDDQVITLTDIEWLIRYRGFTIPDDPDERRSFHRELLTQLINQALVSRESAKASFTQVGEEEIEEFFQLYSKRFSDRAELDRWMAEAGMREMDLRGILTRQIAVNKFIELRFEPFIIVLPDEIELYYREEYVPELSTQQLPVPELTLVEETIRQILTVRRTTEELENWLVGARQRARIETLLFREPEHMPNLPPVFQDSTHLVDDPFSSRPSSNPKSP